MVRALPLFPLWPLIPSSYLTLPCIVGETGILTSWKSLSSPRSNSPYLSSSVHAALAVDVFYTLGVSVYLVHAFYFLCLKARHLQLYQLSFRTVWPHLLRSESLCFPQDFCPQDHWIRHLTSQCFSVLKIILDSFLLKACNFPRLYLGK